MTVIKNLPQWRHYYLTRASLFFFFLFFSFLLKAQNPKIHFSENRMSVSVALIEITKQSNLSFVYDKGLLDGKKMILFDTKDKTLSQALTIILKDSNLSYRIEKEKIVLFPLSAKSNSRKLTGVILDEEGNAIPGVNISLVGTNKGTMSDLNGLFSIDVKNGSVIRISLLSYQAQSFTITDKTAPHQTIKLKESPQALQEVVVTALGIKRDEKSIGYSAPKISSEDLSNTTNHNWLSGLEGKVAGLSIQKGSAGPGGSVRVTLRGESSLSMGNNEALFVVDGVPVYSGMTSSSNTVYAGSEMPIDYGNAAGDIDPNNVESVTVLKGAAATALYGARAGNGAILITTKGGRKEKGIGVDISYDITFENVNRWPDFQYEYGSGNGNNIDYYAYGNNTELGVTSTHTTWAYGPKYDGQMYYQYEGWNYDNPSTSVKTPWLPRKNWHTGFFETGISHRNNVTIKGSNGQGASIRFGATTMNNEWIIPNTGYDSKNLYLSASHQINKKLKVDGRVTYYNRESDNLPTIGYGASSPTYALLWLSNHIDIRWLQSPWLPGKEGIQQNNRINSVFDNPYFIVNEQINTLERNRIYGNVSATYSHDQYLSLMIRGGIDYNAEFRTLRKPMSSTQFAKGYYREQTISNKEQNLSFLLKYDRRFGNFGLVGTVGGNMMQRNYKQVSLQTNKLLRPNVYSLRNTDDPLTPSFTGPRIKAVNSLYALLQLNYKDCVFADFTGRNDWSSTLPKNNNSYFFPSISTSAILSEIFKLGDLYQYVSFIKLRASWAKVGIDTNPYYTDYYYSNSDFPGGATQPTTIPAKNLKPEIVTSYELGTDLRFFKNKLGVDLAYYNSTSKDLIVSVPIPQSTTMQRFTTNAAKIRNQGVELAVFYDVFKSKNVGWRLSGTWSKNINEVLQLAKDLDTWIISSGPAGARIEGRVGGSLGDMYGNALMKAPEGSFITNSDGSKADVSGQVIYKNGYPSLTTDSQESLGNTQPNWKAGISSNFRFKDFSLNITVDGQYGGKVYSLSHSILSQSGKLSNTLPGRYDGFVGEGVMQNENGEWVKNTVVPDNIQIYYELLYKRENTENNMLNTSYLKLREARLEYKLPKKWLEKTKTFQHASVSVYGTNLLTIADFAGFDPEINTLAGANIQAGFEIAQLPGTRTYGFGLKFGF